MVDLTCIGLIHVCCSVSKKDVEILGLQDVLADGPNLDKWMSIEHQQLPEYLEMAAWGQETECFSSMLLVKVEIHNGDHFECSLSWEVLSKCPTTFLAY